MSNAVPLVILGALAYIYKGAEGNGVHDSSSFALLHTVRPSGSLIVFAQPQSKEVPEHEYCRDKTTKKNLTPTARPPNVDHSHSQQIATSQRANGKAY